MVVTLNNEKIYGFKAFNKGLINKYGIKFTEGQIYTVKGQILFGHNGFHFCLNIEDCFRYFDAQNEDIDVAYVKGFGKIVKYDDEYYGYYDMFASEKIEIVKVLTREEIINIVLKRPDYCQLRFIRDFKLAKEERKKFNISKQLIKGFRY